MRLTKKQNPFDVQIGQTWKAKDKRRKENFVIARFERAEAGIIAEAEYSIKGGHVYHKSKINLLNFDRYIRVT